MNGLASSWRPEYNARRVCLSNKSAPVQRVMNTILIFLALLFTIQSNYSKAFYIGNSYGGGINKNKTFCLVFHCILLDDFAPQRFFKMSKAIKIFSSEIIHYSFQFVENAVFLS